MTGGWSAPRPGRFTPTKDPVPFVQEAGWAPGPVWTGAENLASTGIRSPGRPARSESLYRLSYRGRLNLGRGKQFSCSTKANPSCEALPLGTVGGGGAFPDVNRPERESRHSHLVRRLKISGAIAPLPPICLRGVHKDSFTFNI